MNKILKNILVLFALLLTINTQSNGMRRRYKLLPNSETAINSTETTQQVDLVEEQDPPLNRRNKITTKKDYAPLPTAEPILLPTRASTIPTPIPTPSPVEAPILPPTKAQPLPKTELLEMPYPLFQDDHTQSYARLEHPEVIDTPKTTLRVNPEFKIIFIEERLQGDHIVISSREKLETPVLTELTPQVTTKTSEMPMPLFEADFPQARDEETYNRLLNRALVSAVKTEFKEIKLSDFELDPETEHMTLTAGPTINFPFNKKIIYALNRESMEPIVSIYKINADGSNKLVLRCSGVVFQD